jgi:hypothetical protein
MRLNLVIAIIHANALIVSGGSVAHRLFHIRILPHIMLPEKVEGVPADFHQKSLVLCERMGGVNGKRLPVLDRNPLDLEAAETAQPKKTASVFILDRFCFFIDFPRRVANFWVFLFLDSTHVHPAYRMHQL